MTDDVPLLAYDIARAAVAVSVSYETIRLAVKHHDLPARFVGKKALIRPADLEAWLERLPDVQR